ncbi:type II toxin-antitoxin system PemK/MazF family toxin [Bdellovibrionota bacterium FG-1]
MKRGEIYWADLIPRSGSEQLGRRPVIIISHDVFNESPQWHSIIIVPVSTSEKQAQRGPSAVFLQKGTADLKYSSVALCHQITTLDRSKFKERIGMLPASILSEVESGIKAALDIA